MRRRRLYTFRYRERHGEELPVLDALHVEGYTQPKAEAKADAEFREYFNGGKRINWLRTVRELVSVKEIA